MNAPDILACELAARPVGERVAFLHALLAHTAGALVTADGRPRTAEALYRAADKVVDDRTDGL